MAFNVGTLVATIQLNGKSQFDSDLSSSGRNFTQTSTLAQKAGSAISAGFKGAALATGAATVATAAYVASLFKTGVAYNTLQSTSRAALTTLLGGAVQANAQMDKLDAFATTSPFAKSVFITAQQQLIGFGVSAEKVVPTLQAIQDGVAAIGGSNQDIADITTILAQIHAAGKITGEDLLQLGQRGIDAASLIGGSLGKSGSQIREDITAGTLDADTAIDALTKGMETKFAGAAANVKNTFAGTTDRIKAASRDIGSALAEPFVGHEGGGAFITWGNQVADVMRAVQSKVGPIVTVLTGRAYPAFQSITDALNRAKDAVNGWDPSKLEGLLDKVSSYAPAIAGVGGAVLGLNAGFLKGIPILGSFIPAINPVAAAIAGIALSSPESRKALGDMLQAFSPLIPVVGKLAGVLARDLTGILPTVASGITSLAEAATPLIKLIAAIPTPLVLAIAGFAAFKAVQQPLADGLLSAGIGVEKFLGKIGPVGGKLGGIVDGFANMAGVLSGPWGLAIGGAAALIGGTILDNIAQAQQHVEDFTQSLDENTGAITKNTRAEAVKQLHDNGAIEIANKLGVSLKDITDASLGNAGAVQRVLAAQKAWNDEGGHTQAELTQHGILWQDLEAKIGITNSALQSAQKESQNTAIAMGASSQAASAYGDSFATATAAIAANGATLDATTAAGQANQAALDGLATASNGLLASMQAEGAGHASLQAQYDISARKLYDVAGQMGLTGAAADDYVQNHLNHIPGVVTTHVTAEVDQALQAVDAVNRSLATVQRNIAVNIGVAYSHGHINVATTGNGDIAWENGGIAERGVQAFANGGFPSGIYKGSRRPIFKFAEENTNWETFISGKTDQRARNQQILAKTAPRLGMVAVPIGSARPTAFANGGTVDRSVVASQSGSSRSDSNTFTAGQIPPIQVFANDPEAAGLSVFRRLNMLGA